MKNKDFTSAKAKEALLRNKDEKCCGGCCWFYGEQTDGEGMCIVHQFDGDDLPCYCCTMSACSEYVSREEMRHHMAVLLQRVRVFRDGYKAMYVNHYAPKWDELYEMYKFAYKYMKVFSKL